MTHRRTLLSSILIAGLALAGCVTTPAPTTLADTLAARPELSTLGKLVDEAGLSDTLRGPGPFTVFAPTNAAFDALPAATRAQLSQDPQRLKAILRYHVIPGRVPAAEVKAGPAKSAQGANLALSRSGDFVTVDDALVTTPDIAATNGVVHVIDRVLQPPR